MIFITFCFIGAAQSWSHRPQTLWKLLDVYLDLGRELLGRVGFVENKQELTLQCVLRFWGG